MLTKFSVRNFKGFKNEIIFDLSAGNYEFNTGAVKNGIVDKAIIYGVNGIGKSNLGLAIFDIISHMTDKRKDLVHYINYINKESKDDTVDFEYNFIFNGDTVTYKYVKKSYSQLIYEELIINGKSVVSYDKRISNTMNLDLEGAETLNRNLGESDISALKYIKNNSLLRENRTNIAFKNFFDFVDKMLYFRSLKTNQFQGYEKKGATILQDISEHGNTKDFESFLNEAKIKCELVDAEEGKEKTIKWKIGDELCDFYEIASTGTETLALFYVWYQSIVNNSVSFVFIDEFDAFYHQELSELIVSKLKESDAQIILTTHNTSIMTNDLLRPDCYFIMSESKITPISKSTDKELRLGHNLEKMYKAGSFKGVF